MGEPYDWVDDPNLSDDETEAWFDAAMAEGEPVMLVQPIGWRCEHMSIVATGARMPRAPA